MTTALPRRTLLAALAATPLVLAGCTGSPSDAEELLAAHDLPGGTAREVIDALEALPLDERPAELLASVGTDVLTLSDATGQEATLDLPAEELYVSVAPFVTGTHECFFHSLTTCLGELAEEELDVRVEDASGTVLVDASRTTAPNGFLGLWLPRSEELTLRLAGAAGEATTTLRTDAEAPTCLTTMQLGA
ncbi:CueP family metal-binding protein [Brachybacterium atlanticum]|uniref:CueP family metal-binding protein n=1 Tax=Brachybacterium atlanticum TaxID=2911888 RepID=UPI0021E03A62|nr:CueP family metal-binding protein [Brachybacterium atlanticum]